MNPRGLTQAQAGQIDDLRGAFATLREAQAAYWRAAQNAHSELVALAQGPQTPQGHDHEPSARPPEGGLAPARREGAERQGCTHAH